MSGERTLPGLGLLAGWTQGSGGWKPGMDANLRTLSVLVQPVAASRVTALPASPAEGSCYIVPSAASANANALAAWDNGAYVYFAPRAGWLVFVADEGKTLRWSGTAWTELAAAAGGIPDAPHDGKQYARKDGGWVEVVSTGGSGGSGGAPTPHKYWRVVCTKDNGNGIGLAEVQFRQAVGSSQQALGGTALSNGDLGATWPASAAFDNNSSSFWASNGAGPLVWIGYEFPAAIVPVELALTKRPPGYGDSGPMEFHVDWSDDGEAWTSLPTVYTLTDVSDGGGWPSSTTKLFAIPSY